MLVAITWCFIFAQISYASKIWRGKIYYLFCLIGDELLKIGMGSMKRWKVQNNQIQKYKYSSSLIYKDEYLASLTFSCSFYYKPTCIITNIRICLAISNIRIVSFWRYSYSVSSIDILIYILFRCKPLPCKEGIGAFVMAHEDDASCCTLSLHNDRGFWRKRIYDSHLSKFY